MMTQEDYNNLVSSLVKQLLEDENPDTVNAISGIKQEKDKSKVSNTTAAVAGAAATNIDGLLDWFKKLVGSHHFGSHAGLRGETSGTGSNN